MIKYLFLNYPVFYFFNEIPILTGFTLRLVLTEQKVEQYFGKIPPKTYYYNIFYLKEIIITIFIIYISFIFILRNIKNLFS